MNTTTIEDFLKLMDASEILLKQVMSIPQCSETGTYHMECAGTIKDALTQHKQDCLEFQRNFKHIDKTLEITATAHLKQRTELIEEALTFLTKINEVKNTNREFTDSLVVAGII